MPINQKIVKWIKFGADYSFTLYLIHFPILVLVQNIFPDISTSIMWIAILMINIISVLLASFTENEIQNGF